MTTVRNPKAAARESYDLIVIGGGIHGACLALESARRGLRPLLLEQSDFCGATSWNTLRVLHGGLRYLQHLDIPRLLESGREQRWFLRHFSDLVRPLGCLMPLYGRGLRRPAVFRAALAINDYLSRHGNGGMGQARRLPRGTVLSAAKTAELFPTVDRRGLRGGACWYDAVILNPQRVMLEILRWACQCGAVALNYVEATGLLVKNGRVTAIEAVDRETEDVLRFRTPVVVNCAGPWCRQVAEKFDRDIPRLFYPSLAFNVLLDHPSLSHHALAVTPKRPDARTYFLLPLEDRILAGTHHSACSHSATCPQPSREQVGELLSDLNQAVPGLNVTQRDVLRIHAGLLPVTAAGSPRQADRAIVLDHGSRGGPKGLFSVSGVKFTTARSVAEKALGTIYRNKVTTQRLGAEAERPAAGHELDIDDFTLHQRDCVHENGAELKQLVAEEAVVHLDDLVLRRTNWADRPERTWDVAESASRLLGWGQARRAREMARLERVLRLPPGLPAEP